MRVIVYFESKGYAEEVANFANEQLYMRCLPALEQLAREQRMVVTESIRDEEDDTGERKPMTKDERAEFDYWQLYGKGGV